MLSWCTWHFRAGHWGEQLESACRLNSSCSLWPGGGSLSRLESCRIMPCSLARFMQQPRIEALRCRSCTVVALFICAPFRFVLLWAVRQESRFDIRVGWGFGRIAAPGAGNFRSDSTKLNQSEPALEGNAALCHWCWHDSLMHLRHSRA